MTTVTIFQFEVYKMDSEEVVRSRRWGIREAIRNIACGRVLEDTARRVDESVVASDLEGFTKCDFDSDASPSGFQTRVR